MDSPARHIGKLSGKMRAAVEAKIEALSTGAAQGEPLRYYDYWYARVGNYRIFYTPEPFAVLSIQHRGQAFKGGHGHGSKGR